MNILIILAHYSLQAFYLLISYQTETVLITSSEFCFVVRVSSRRRVLDIIRVKILCNVY